MHHLCRRTRRGLSPVGATMSFIALELVDLNDNPRGEYGIYYTVDDDDGVRLAIERRPRSYSTFACFDWAYDRAPLTEWEAGYVARQLNARGLSFSLEYLRADSDVDMGSVVDGILAAYYDRPGWVVAIVLDGTRAGLFRFSSIRSVDPAFQWVGEDIRDEDLHPTLQSAMHSAERIGLTVWRVCP